MDFVWVILSGTSSALHRSCGDTMVVCEELTPISFVVPPAVCTAIRGVVAALSRIAPAVAAHARCGMSRASIPRHHPPRLRLLLRHYEMPTVNAEAMHDPATPPPLRCLNSLYPATVAPCRLTKVHGATGPEAVAWLSTSEAAAETGSVLCLGGWVN